MANDSEITGFFASASQWQGAFARCLIHDNDSDNRELPPLFSDLHTTDKKIFRDLRRYLIGSLSENDSPLMLSVPVTHDSTLTVSNHGRWRHLHRNALQARYARAPYYHEFMSDLEPLFRKEPPYPLEELLHDGILIIYKWLGLPDSLELIKELSHQNPQRYELLRIEYQSAVDPNLWIGDLILRTGKQAVFALLPPLESF